MHLFSLLYDALMTIGGQGCTVPIDPPYTNYTTRCPGESDVEYRTEFTMWSMGGSILIFATDPRNFTSIMAEVLLNTEIIAINQDPAGGAGAQRVGYSDCGSGAGPEQCQLWHRVNSTGAHFVALLNPNDPGPGVGNASITFNFNSIGIGSGSSVAVRDLWLHQDMGVFTSTYTADAIPPHGVAALQLIVN